VGGEERRGEQDVIAYHLLDHPNHLKSSSIGISLLHRRTVSFESLQSKASHLYQDKMFGEGRSESPR